MTPITESVTFRFEKMVLEQLKREAEQKRINLNTLLNQIVKSHIEWHALAPQAGYVPLRKPLIRGMVDSLTREQIDEIANRYVQDVSDPTLMITGKKFSPESFLELVDRWMRATGFEYQHEVSKSNNNHRHFVYVILHNMGQNWSYLMAQILGRAASSFTIKKPDMRATESTLYIALDLE
ncbi:MAG TPA: hypothetical protein VFT58_02950 [Nitrososphaera sp.]|jgi:hypothetical protein|nr:hypothetical protein [uncultured Nitrososphaera sp.]HEU4984575.1 hypothetical protein [Nitrososphaera sp.]